jgi:hypothetical protein
MAQAGSHAHSRIQPPPQSIADEGDGQPVTGIIASIKWAQAGLKEQEQSDAFAWQSDQPVMLDYCGVRGRNLPLRIDCSTN